MLTASGAPSSTFSTCSPLPTPPGAYLCPNITLFLCLCLAHPSLSPSLQMATVWCPTQYSAGIWHLVSVAEQPKPKLQRVLFHFECKTSKWPPIIWNLIFTQTEIYKSNWLLFLSVISHCRYTPCCCCSSCCCCALHRAKSH